MRLSTIFLVSAQFLVAACDPAGHDAYQLYEDKDTGWTTQYPASWELTDVNRNDPQPRTSAIEKKISLSGKNLLHIRRDAINSFISASQPYDSAMNGPYDELQELVFDAIIEAYDREGLPYDVTFGSERIDTIPFSTMEITLYAPERKKILMNRIVYDALVRPAQSLTINISFDNEEDRKTLIEILNASRFSKEI